MKLTEALRRHRKLLAVDKDREKRMREADTYRVAPSGKSAPRI